MLPCRLRTHLLPLVACLVITPSIAAAAPVSYVALGDSTAVGVGARQGGGYPQRLARRLEASGVAVKLDVYAVSGATIADLRRVQLPRLLAARPGLVTIGIGLNDLVQGRDLRDFARDLEVVADLVRRTNAVVVVSTLPDVARSPSAKGSPPSLGRRLEAYNATIRTVAERHGFQVAEVTAATRPPVAGGAGLFAPDGFHPNDAGYDRWTAAMLPAALRALGSRLQARRPPVPKER